MMPSCRNNIKIIQSCEFTTVNSDYLRTTKRKRFCICIYILFSRSHLSRCERNSQCKRSNPELDFAETVVCRNICEAQVDSNFLLLRCNIHLLLGLMISLLLHLSITLQHPFSFTLGELQRQPVIQATLLTSAQSTLASRLSHAPAGNRCSCNQLTDRIFPE